MGNLLDQLKAALGAGQTKSSGEDKSRTADISAQDYADCAANGESPEACRARLLKQQHSDSNH